MNDFPALFALMNQWEQDEFDAVDIDTGLATLGKLITAAAPLTPQTGPLLVALAALVPLYVEFGTDPDGEASSRVYEEFSALGWTAKIEQ